MKFGVCIPNYGETSSVEGITSVTLEAERLGYDSVWTTDHILMSMRSGTPYERIFDSVASLAFVAPRTKRVRLGISCLIVAMRNPAAVAKQLATIDAFSDGRVLLGVGVGWNEREFLNVGSDFHNRGKRVDESVGLLKALWRGETDFRGKRTNLDAKDVVFDPKPSARELEVWIGGLSDAAMRRANRLGDAWHPNVLPLDAFKGLLRKYREVSGSGGKPVCVRIGIDLKAEKPEYVGAQGDRRLRLTGDMAANAKTVSELESLGVSQAIVVPSPEGKTSTKDQLESIGIFAEKFLN